MEINSRDSMLLVIKIEGSLRNDIQERTHHILKSVALTFRILDIETGESMSLSLKLEE